MGSTSSGPARLDGRPLDTRPGETLVQTLARRRLPILGRSTRYHRPRAPFCGIGACSQCLVRVNGQSGVRSCRYVPAPGDRIETENAWPSTRLDLLAVFDSVFYSGIDTLHGFRRPRWATPAYQWAVRRLAGFGRLAEAPPDGPRLVGTRIRTDVVVIGGGPSGRAAAATVAHAGRATLLLDRGAPVEPLPGVSVRPHTTAIFLPPPIPERERSFELLAAEEGRGGVAIEANHVIVANGGYDAGLLFAGNDRPGVMSAEGAESLVARGGRPPFDHAVLFGGGERVGTLIERYPNAIDAVVAPGRIAPAVAESASRLQIPLFPRTLLVAAGGRSRVRNVSLRSRGDGRSFPLDADAVIVAHRRLPLPQLFFQCGAKMEWGSATGAYYPVLSDGVRTSVDGLFAVGEVAGFLGESAAPSGAAAATIALGIPPPSLPPRALDEPTTEMLGYLRELRPWLAGSRRAILCPCEDILVHEVEDAVRSGYRGIEVIKRMTGVGTGLCQGRFCLPDTLLLLSILEDRPPSEVGYITQRPPVLPVSLESLATIPDEGGGAA
ncbi:MAG: 2Fe-2S iron-sulfur cluster-binding protein [Thermoplasmata archaeon]|nr:2Fe-2S iron-sulfur cluster-binding protein [Thermoplasmata archaeon]